MSDLQNQLIEYLNETDVPRICGKLESMIVRTECYEDVPDLVKIELYSMALDQLSGNQIRISAELDNDLVFGHYSKSTLPSKAIETHLVDVIGPDCTYLFSYRSDVSSPHDKVNVSLVVISKDSPSSFRDHFEEPLLKNGVFENLEFKTGAIQPLNDLEFGYSITGVSAWVLAALRNPKKIRKCFDYRFQEEFDGKIIPLKDSSKGVIIRNARVDAGLRRRRVEFFQFLDLISVSADVERSAEEIWPELQSSVIKRLYAELVLVAA